MRDTQLASPVLTGRERDWKRSAHHNGRDDARR